MSEDTKMESLRMKGKVGLANNGFIADEGLEEKEGDGSCPAELPETCTLAIQEAAPQPPGSAILKPYAGMPKEVLLQFSSQARYRVTREVIFWLIIGGTLVIIGATIAIIALSPKCLVWWQASPIYQVYPRSFKDSNMDGSGDLKGIQEKLDHFQYLNIKTVWIAPFYQTSIKDFRYAVDDFRAIDPTFGTMKDFDNLIAAMHDKGLKLVMDLIPNHTSDKHNWFQLSRNRTGKYTDYYIWHNCTAGGTEATPPNNWVSFYGNSSWQYDDARKQCYFHQFLKEQPDLNIRNPDVQAEIKEIMSFWLAKGVDGFRVDAAKFLLEAEHLRNEPQVNTSQNADTVTSYSELFHDYTTTQVGMHDIVRRFRQTMNEYSREADKYRFMSVESNDGKDIEKTMMYYGNSFIEEANFPYNVYLLDLNKELSGNIIFDTVNFWMKAMPKGKWPNWVLGSPSNPRIASRVGKEYTNVINMLLLTLPGTPVTYYGEELGMTDYTMNINQSGHNFGIHDPREDPEKTPMQWNANPNAGFTTANETWLPVNEDYTAINVENQKAHPNSSLNLYRELSLLRQNELPIHRGWMCHIYNDKDVFAYVREFDGLDTTFMMVLNFGNASRTDVQVAGIELPVQAQIRLSTNFNNKGKTVNVGSIPTEKGEGLVLQYKTNKPVHTMANFKNNCYVSEKACYLMALNLLYKNC
ncbi:amino acid transporter heavy chain SLC3A1 [Lissotriton helveticus]